MTARTIGHKDRPRLYVRTNGEVLTYESTTTILTRRSKQFRLAKLRLSTSLEPVHSMLLPKVLRTAHHAEVVRLRALAVPNPLTSQMGQNVKSPFSNFHAVTFKLCPRLIRARRTSPAFNSRPSQI
jgi:hypothetical protein